MSSTADIASAEDELERLAANLETVVRPNEYLKAVLALGHRARSLFLGFRQLLEGPTPAAAMSLVRPMVEINLLLRFLGRNPELHLELWFAEGDRQRLVFLDEYASEPLLLERRAAFPSPTDPRLEPTRAGVEEARAKALAANVKGVSKRKGGRVFPTIATISKTIDDLGAREAYLLAYRWHGADVHMGVSAFRSGVFAERVGGLLSYSDSAHLDHIPAARALAVTTFASTLCIVSAVLGLDIHEQADAIKRRFTPEGELPIAERLAQGNLP